MLPITPTDGNETFPATENAYYKSVEKIARQEIMNVKSTSKLDDAVYYYDMTGEADYGDVIEQMLIDKAKAQAYDPNTCIITPNDPTVAVRYFKDWNTRVYKATIRRNEVRRILAKCRGDNYVETFAGQILDTVTQGNDDDEFLYERQLITETKLTDFGSSILNGTPANMQGVIFAIREMYNYVKGMNTHFTVTGFKMSTPASDIRVGLSERLMNLIDVGELSRILNLSKEELFGKLVIIPTTDQEAPALYKVIVYDRKAFNRARRVYSLDPKECDPKFKNFELTVEDMYFYSPLFKATSLDVTSAATAKYNELITPLPSTSANK